MTYIPKNLKVNQKQLETCVVITVNSAVFSKNVLLYKLIYCEQHKY